ncbi:MAG: hypothetical protein RL088_3766 [Verrucomicrobiota bacterium]|jgi:hypothetical protein
MKGTHPITHAAWLGDGFLLLVTTLPANPKPLVAWIRGSDTRNCRARVHPISGGSILFIALRHGMSRPQPSHELRIRSEEQDATVAISDLPRADLKTVARNCFAALPPDGRASLLDFLAGTAGEPDIRLSRNLASLRDILRERLAECVVGPDQTQAVHIEQLFTLDHSVFFVRGWFSDGDAAATSLRLVSPEGARVELLDGAYRYARPDVARMFGLSSDTQHFGFVRHFELPTPSVVPKGWVAELHAEGIESLESNVPDTIGDADQIKNTLLGLLPAHGIGELLKNHIHPAMTHLAARQRRSVSVASVEQFGTAPAAPDVSIIVTLEGGTLIEHQLAEFANDPAVRDADLIFFLSNPAHAAKLAAAAAHFTRIYAVPFRLAVPAAPLTDALARNAAAPLALAPRLVFLASSVFPDRSGWLAPLLTANPDGAAGAKLLREDDTLAHAGVILLRNASAWIPRSRFRGLQRHLPEACIGAEVPKLSGACFAVSRANFERVGGFSAAYATPQLDEADFFLRLAALGVPNRYVPEAELYHLPVLKKPPEISAGAALYDAWMFDHAHGASLYQNAD